VVFVVLKCFQVICAKENDQSQATDGRVLLNDLVSIGQRTKPYIG
jgi:hypothetical protein